MHTATRVLVVAVVVLSAMSVAQARPGDRVERRPSLVNQGDAQPYIPAIGRDASGHSLVVWSIYADDLAYRGIFGRWYAPDGTPLGQEFRISPEEPSLFFRPEVSAVAVAPNGAAVVTWFDNAAYSTNLILARRLSPRGAPVGGAINVNNTAQEPGGSWDLPPSVAMANDGSFVVSWISLNPKANNNTTVWVRAFDATGTAKGPAVNVDPTGASPRFRSTDVAMDAAGKFLVVWEQGDFNSDTIYSFGRRFDASGAPLGGRFTITSPGPLLTLPPRVAMASDGRFVVVYNRFDNEGPFGSQSYRIAGRRYAADATPLGGEFSASTNGLVNFRNEVDVAMDDDGDFVVTWIEQAPNGETQLHSRLYAASGKALTPDRGYSFDHIGPRYDHVAMDAVGNYAATWYVEGNPARGVYIQHFAGPDDTRPGCAAFIAGVVGTAANDLLAGTAGDDVITGLGGNDTIHAGGGNDIVCGDDGDDQLYGESGTDHLQGGNGDDVLDGGVDADICNGNGQTNADTAVQCERVLRVP